MDTQQIGILTFQNGDSEENLKVYWKPKLGYPQEGTSWVAAMSFSSNYLISTEAYRLIFSALENDAINLTFQPEAGIHSRCVIADIGEIADGGIMIGSPDQGREKIIRTHPRAHTD